MNSSTSESRPLFRFVRYGASIPNPDPEQDDNFGADVAVTDQQFVVGVDAVTSTPNRSRAYVFTLENGSASRRFTLTPDGEETPGTFGASVAMNDTRAVVGAPIDPTTGVTESGSAVVFKRTENDWPEATTLSSGYDHQERYGTAVATNAQYTFVGAHFAITRAEVDTGAAFLEPHSQDANGTRFELNHSELGEGAYLGFDVALGDSTAVVSAINAQSDTSHQGQVYVLSTDEIQP